MKIKVDNKMLKRFLEIMEGYKEPIFGNNNEIKRQLELCLNTQGYWSANFIRVYWDKDTKDFRIEPRRF